MSDHYARALRQIAAQSASAPDGDVLGRLRQLCAAATQELSACGAGVTVLATGGLQGLMVASDPTSERIEQLQLVLGEGPSVDALATHRPVLVADLDAAATSRWPLYCAGVYNNGVRAVFAFPLQVGAAQLGVLTIFRALPGPLSADELAQALTFVEIAVHALIGGQGGAAIGNALTAALEHHAALFQAQGMVMVQLGVPLAEALARMRAYAFAEGRDLTEVAMAIVARSVSFEPDR